MSKSIVSQADSVAIEAVQKGDRLVVDSRLVADNLGIEHETFMRTIKKYEARIEQRFGVIRFEIGKPPQGSQGGRPEKFAWLDEDQSMFLMTLSRNTDQVVECKANLVEAFSRARKIIPVLVEENETLRMQLELAKVQRDLERERNRGKEIDSTMIQLHGDRVVLALRGLSNQIIEKETVVTEILEPSTGYTTKFLSADQLKKAVLERTGQRLKSMKQFTDAIRSAGRDDLLVPVSRPNTSEYVPPNALDEAIAVVYGNCRQRLLGE